MRKKGFTLLETLIIIAVVVTISAFGSLKVRERAEKNALIIFKSKVPEFIRVASQRAFEKGEDYYIILNTAEEVVRLEDGEANIEEEIFLPETLDYVLGKGTTVEYKIKLDDTGHGTLVGAGGLNRNLFVFDSKDRALYKVNMRDNTPLKYVIVGTYTPGESLTSSNYLTGDWVKE